MNTHKGHYLVFWKFQVKPEAKLPFEEAYGPDGDWSRLFRRSPQYRGTQFFRDLDHPGRYLTLDRWTSQAAFRQFKLDHQAEYDTFDQRCESLTVDEFLMGEFEESDPRF